MKEFKVDLTLSDGTTSSRTLSAINYRTALQQALAFIPAWGNRTIKAVSVTMCGV